MNDTKNHIFIIGMMGSGKSSLVPILSKILSIPYIDTDMDLMQILDAEIKEIFQSITKTKFYIKTILNLSVFCQNKQLI